MKNQQAGVPKFFMIATLAIGVLVLVFAIFSGNDPVVRPNLEKYASNLKQNMVSSDQLVEWTINDRTDFLAAGLRSEAECAEQEAKTKVFECYDKSKLNDVQWVRKVFRNSDLPIVVIGTNTEDGLTSAAQLAYLGYRVRVLNGGFTNFENEYLQADTENIEIAVASKKDLKRLAIYRYFTGHDPLVKKPGQSWAVAMGKGQPEEEAEGVEEGEGSDDGWESFDTAEGC